jgi:predicted PurR-regulated permease PerM
MMDHTFGSGFGIVITIFVFVLAILWFLLPFAVFGIKDKLNQLIESGNETNRLLNTLINENRTSGDQHSQTRQESAHPEA